MNNTNNTLINIFNLIEPLINLFLNKLMNTSYILSNTSLRQQRIKIKNNRSNSNLRSCKNKLNSTEYHCPSNSFVAFCQSESLPKQNTLSSLTSTTTHHYTFPLKNLQMYHIRYEFLANKQHTENEASLKHDILVLINQLKEKEDELNEMKTLLKKYEENNKNSNRSGGSNQGVQQMLNEKLFEQVSENKKLQEEIRELRTQLNQLKIYNKFNLDKLETCRQYSFNYMIFNSNIKQTTNKIIQHNNNSTYCIKSINLTDNLNGQIKFSKRNKINSSLSSLIFKPLIEGKILQYDYFDNSFTLITPIDYSNFFRNYSICGSRYITINNMLYIISGTSFNILYSFNPISNALLKLITLEHNHKYCGLVQYQDNKLAIIGGENTNTIEIYNISTRKLYSNDNNNTNIIPGIPCLTPTSSFLVMKKNIIICYGGFKDNQLNNCCLVYQPLNNKWECVQLKGTSIMKKGLLFNNIGLEKMVYVYTVDGKIFQINIEDGNVELIKDNMNGVCSLKELSFEMMPKEICENGSSLVCFCDSNHNVYKLSLSDFNLECEHF